MTKAPVTRKATSPSVATLVTRALDHIEDCGLRYEVHTTSQGATLYHLTTKRDCIFLCCLPEQELIDRFGLHV